MFEICLLVLIEYMNVTDGRTDGQTSHSGIGRAAVINGTSKTHLNTKNGQLYRV